MQWMLAALFFVSGISSLVYQTLWLRLLSLVFGVTVYASACACCLVVTPPVPASGGTGLDVGIAIQCSLALVNEVD